MFANFVRRSSRVVVVNVRGAPIGGRITSSLSLLSPSSSLNLSLMPPRRFFAEQQAARRSTKSTHAAADEESPSANAANTATTATVDPDLFMFVQLSEPTKAALQKQNIAALFPIQSHTLKHTIAGRDLIGRAFTGTGKVIVIYEQRSLLSFHFC
jgi:hypothetical protein